MDASRSIPVRALDVHRGGGCAVALLGLLPAVGIRADVTGRLRPVALLLERREAWSASPLLTLEPPVRNPSDRPTWMTSSGPVARYVAQPVGRFLAVEASGGVLLLGATVVALVWANSPWSASYESLWHTSASIEAGPLLLREDLQHWVNDGLMALFFFVVGLEIKREIVTGQLRSARDAALPVVAALGGMVIPAALFLLINAGGDGSSGWGIPMATDIAFTVGVLALLGDRVPPALKVLLLALAIADDIGAIIVIAVFYSDEIDVTWLAAAAVAFIVVCLMQRAKVWYAPAYLVVGVVVWGCTLESGVHATIAGVALGLLTPARPLLPEPEPDRVAERLAIADDVNAEEARGVAFELRESVSVAERLEDALHPWTSYLVIPLFALANAGIPLSGDVLDDAATSTIALGVVVGLVIGKPVGIGLFSWLAVRAGVARLPAGVRWSHLVGIAALAGIGFTVSIFITGLAYTDVALQDEAKIGVLVASLLSAVIGTIALWRSGAGNPGSAKRAAAAADPSPPR